jgi:outer membrane protein
MRRVIVVTFIAVLLGAVGSASAASDFSAGVRGAYWFPELSGNAQTTTNGVQDTRFDVKDTLGMKDENIPYGEAFLRYGRTTLRVGYARLSFDGSKTLTDNVVFNGVPYSVSDNVVSKLEMKTADAEVQIDLLRPDLGVADFNLGLIVKLKYVDGEVELRGTAQTERRDFQAPIPMIGVAVGVGALKDVLRADARATGIAYSGNHLYEADVFASLTPLPFLRIQGGYRLIDLKIDESDILASFRLKGPYAGAQLSF